jgi:2-dehydro-3-deoxyphosphogalactonate aldolase
MSSFRARMERAPLIAIVRGIRPDEVVSIGAALVDAGFEIVEVPLNSPAALSSIEMLARKFGDTALIGAGTVLRVQDVHAISNAGGRLIVMPHTDEAIIRRAKAQNLVCIPGFATPTEAFRAIAASADALKLFPAQGSSPSVLKGLREVLPHDLPLIPVGGIDETQFEKWVGAGAAGFGIGSALFKAGITATELRDRADKLLAGWKALTRHP